MALSTVRNILRNRHVVVVGSAPMSAEEQSIVEAADCVVVVNGAIGSTTRTPDLWICNSREYNDDVFTDPKRWPEDRKLLHAAMLNQAAHKQVRHVVFLKKSFTSEQTIQKLKAQGTTWRAMTELHTGLKSDIGWRVGIKSFHIAFNVSAGLWAACLALYCKAAEVRLVGFSFNNTYSYIDNVPPDTRKHIAQDLEALPQIMNKHPELIISPSVRSHIEALHP